ncbi:MAG: glycosyltransferase family 39 protein [Bryobacteraceae bacterium]|nr:glycosyltransferase family 39 protein [Bryobacteraceae bacterium]
MRIALVFALSFAFLAATASKPRLTEAWVDPVSRLEAQDEATYANTAAGMAEGQGWLTPKFLGRLALYKPPLLYWAEGASLRAFGFSRFALRLPSLLAGAAVCAILYAWAGLAAPLLLLGSHQFFVLSRIGLTDSLLLLFTAAALFALARDPRLERAWPWFGVCSGLAILTKSVAGLLAPLALILYWAIARERPAFRDLVRAGAVCIAVMLPWHLYQLAVNPNWFRAEYILSELIGYGASAPSQTSDENQALFYIRRLWAVDPLLVIAAALAMPAAWRKRESATARVAACWVVAQTVCVLAFSYRSAAYLLPLLPPLAILASEFLPRYRVGAVAMLALAAKLLFPHDPAGIPFTGEFHNPALPAMEAYCGRNRGNELILVNTDDQFYSGVLPLARVRYLYLAPPDTATQPLDFDTLGIRVTADEFLRLDSLEPAYHARLREFDLDSTRPLATAILTPSADALARLIAARPGSDFYLPQGLIDEARLRESHEVWKVTTHRWIALSRQEQPRTPHRGCGF